MGKKFLALLLSSVMCVSLLAGCGSSSSDTTEETAQEETEEEEETEEAEVDEETEEAADTEGTDYADMTIAIVTKSAGNPYNELEASGFQEVVESYGATCIVVHPESATVEAQISEIQSLISQEVDAICVAANDEDALQATLEEAMDAGIMVSCLDSKVNAESRATFVNQAGVYEVAQALMDAVLDLTGGEGQWAILSATSQASNQNAWIAAMEDIATGDEYAGLELVEIAYGDDESQKSTDQTEALLANYPDLKVICSPTTVGIAAAAKVIQESDTDVKLTGLGLPSEMAAYIGEGDDYACPYMYLWNPIDVGALGAYVSIALVEGTITGAAGETFDAGDMGTYTIQEADDGGTEVIVGPPFEFTPDNIDEWKDVY